jgi:hypothetical protein
MLHKRSANERGSSLVEVVLALPVLLILFLGIVEVAFLLFAHVQVANATREGARYGSLCRLNANCDNLTAVVQDTVFSEAQFLTMTDIGAGGNTAVVVQPSTLSSVPRCRTRHRVLRSPVSEYDGYRCWGQHSTRSPTLDALICSCRG